MTNEDAIKVLEDIRLFVAAEQLDALNYTIDVLSDIAGRAGEKR